MKARIAAYWHKGGLEIYRIAEKGPVQCASGSLDALRPSRCGSGKKVLIVGRELLLHTRKKYPPAPEKELRKAVALEIGEMFPFPAPAFYCQVFQSTETHALVDVWAWESALYPQIKEVFPFDYVVPEDLAFFSAVPEITLCSHGGVTNMLASAGGRFLAGASYPDSVFGQEAGERFLRSLEQHGAPINSLVIYGDIPFQREGVQISRKGEMGFPPCLEGISRLNLSGFRIEGGFRLGEKTGFLFRIAVYLVLGYALMQYLTLKNYDRADGEIRQRVAVMEGRLASVDAGRQKQVEDYSEIVREVEQKEGAASSPLKAMDMLARKLPEGAFVTRMSFNENKMDVTVSSNDPLSALKALGAAPEVKKMDLKGPIVKSLGASLSNFSVAIEFAR